jgi:hypothetical protein
MLHRGWFICYGKQLFTFNGFAVIICSRWFTIFLQINTKSSLYKQHGEESIKSKSWENPEKINLIMKEQEKKCLLLWNGLAYKTVEENLLSKHFYYRKIYQMDNLSPFKWHLVILNSLHLFICERESNFSRSMVLQLSSSADDSQFFAYSCKYKSLKASWWRKHQIKISRKSLSK